MADKPTLYVNYQEGTIRGPGDTIGRLFSDPKAISNPQRLQHTVARLRQLGYPLVEHPQPEQV